MFVCIAVYIAAIKLIYDQKSYVNVKKDTFKLPIRCDLSKMGHPRRCLLTRNFFNAESNDIRGQGWR